MIFVVMLIFAANCVRYLREAAPDRGGMLFGVVVEGALLTLALIALGMLTLGEGIL